MAPRSPPASPMAAATLANEPGTLGISSRIVRLYEAEGSCAMPAEAYLGDAAPKRGQEGKMARRRTVKRSANRALGGVEMTRRIRRKLVRRGALALAAM